MERGSGADVAEDSPRGAEKSLLDTPFLADDAEVEVWRVLDSSGPDRLCDLRAFGAIDVVGSLRMSSFKAGSWSSFSSVWERMEEHPPKTGVACPEACTGLPRHASPEKILVPFLSARSFSKRDE